MEKVKRLVSLDKVWCDKMDAYCDAHGLTRSGFIETATKYYLERVLKAQMILDEIDKVGEL